MGEDFFNSLRVSNVRDFEGVKSLGYNVKAANLFYQFKNIFNALVMA